MSCYYSFVHSLLQYGILGWGGLGVTLCQKLNILQKRFLKIIIGKPLTYPSDLVYSTTGAFNIRKMFVKSMIRFYYQNQSLFPVINHTFHTRARRNHNLQTIRFHTSIGQSCFMYYTPHIINSFISSFNSPIFLSLPTLNRLIKNWISQNKNFIDSFF